MYCLKKTLDGQLEQLLCRQYLSDNISNARLGRWLVFNDEITAQQDAAEYASDAISEAETDLKQPAILG